MKTPFVLKKILNTFLLKTKARTNRPKIWELLWIEIYPKYYLYVTFVAHVPQSSHIIILKREQMKLQVWHTIVKLNTAFLLCIIYRHKICFLNNASIWKLLIEQ